MRLPPQPSERIDRAIPVAFTYEGAAVSGFVGDTLGSALFASGRRVFSRSFKYHRPRGLLCCSGHCANCLMTVDGVPNVRVCVEPIREGVDVRGQNVLGSVDRDLMSAVDRFGGPFTPVGFYYRTMIRPRRAWPLYEKFLRNAAGLGRVGGASHRRYDTEHRRVDVLVVGGGRAGRQAAAAAAAEGRRVLVVDELGTGTADGAAGADHNLPANLLRRPEVPGRRVVSGAPPSADARIRTMPAPAAKPSNSAAAPTMTDGGGELRFSGRSALEMMRIFLVSTCSCSVVSRERTRNDS